MNRRHFMQATIVGGLASGVLPFSTAQDQGRKYLTMEWYHCRRDLDVARLTDFLGGSAVPAYNRAGAKPVGLFQTSIGPDSPTILMVAPFSSMAAIQNAMDGLARDAKWTSDLAAFDEKWDLAYERRESSLLRTFQSFPDIQIPTTQNGKANVFELRVYESRNQLGHTKKVAMFDGGEIDIFRRTGINPVFFGATLFGARMPNLAYMVWFPSLEARAEAWGKFGRDPEWKKLSTAPGNADRELVCRISNQIMTPLASSQLR